jgi:hypothetical protein
MDPPLAIMYTPLVRRAQRFNSFTIGAQMRLLTPTTPLSPHCRSHYLVGGLDAYSHQRVHIGR